MKNILKFSIKLWLLAVGVFLINDASSAEETTASKNCTLEEFQKELLGSTLCDSNPECKASEIAASIKLKQRASQCIDSAEQNLINNKAEIDRQKAALQASIGDRDSILQAINDLEKKIALEEENLRELNEMRVQKLAEMQKDGCKAIEEMRRSNEPFTIKLDNGVIVPFTPPKYCVQFFESIGGNNSVQGETGMDLFSSYVRILYQYGAALIGFVAVLVIVISGVQIMMGGMSQENISSAKTRILQAIFSIMLLFGSALILKTINPGFFT